MPRLGAMRHRVTILRRAPGTDSRGQPNGRWRSVGELYAGIRPLTLRELEQAQRLYPIATSAVEMRYHPQIVPMARDRLTLSGRTLEIGSVVNVEGRNRDLMLMVSELAN